MSIGSRIKELRKHRNITIKSLAKELGVSQGAIGHWEKDRSYPSVDTLVEVSEILGCDLNYLFQDVTNVNPITFTTSVSEQKLITKFRVLPEYIQKGVEALVDYFYKDKIRSDEDNFDRMVELPTLVNVDLDDHYSLYVVIGEAMKPLFNDGDVVIVEPASLLKDGETGIFKYHGKNIIRRFENNVLLPVNDMYEDIKVSRKNPVEVIGRVKGKV